MWKYGSALQQRPELNPYSGRGATSHNWHAPKPHRKQVLGVLKGEERCMSNSTINQQFHSVQPREGTRGPGPRGWGPTRQPLGPRWTGRTRLAAVGAVGPARQPHPRARAADGRAHLAAARARPKAASPARPTGAARPRPDGHRRRPSARRSGARESGEKGESERRSSAHPETTTTTRTAAGAEESGGAARDDDDGGAPTVGERNGGADEVDGDAAKPKEVAPSRAEDRSDVGGEPKVGGDGGERGARRGHETDGESERRAAETEERSTGIEYIATGGGERGRGERKPRAEISGAIEDAGELRGMNPDESEGEREGKEGESGEGNAGSNSPLFNARGDGGMRRNPRRRRR
ncbi:pr1-like protein [Oryza sativa Japonica Group]|uniref:Pr1-like protein n=1 Tax=Oryza sativa subsp. japonica TaxID=39947 RepID=Q5ZCU0_ORYSJ|nr:pr1-like protein [Oryza sativa Japonica Group]